MRPNSSDDKYNINNDEINKSALKRENVKRHNKYKLDDNATSDSFFKFVDRELERLEKKID